MSSAVAFALLALALLLPIVGALALRLLGPRLTERRFYVLAALLFAIVVASVLALARGPYTSVQIGGLALLLPAGAGTDLVPALPDMPPGVDTPPDLPPATSPTSEVFLPITDALTASEPLTDTLPPYPSLTDVPTPAPTVLEEPTPEPATPEPPTAVPAPPEPQPQRSYTVQPGDTLRGIAEQFDVSVEDLLAANNLTPAEADSLQPGQDLVIP